MSNSMYVRQLVDNKAKLDRLGMVWCNELQSAIRSLGTYLSSGGCRVLLVLSELLLLGLLKALGSDLGTSRRDWPPWSIVVGYLTTSAVE